MHRLHLVVLVAVAALLLAAGPAHARQDRASISDPGSVFIVPKVELRWSADGSTLLQDTFIHLVNDATTAVRVRMFYVHGDAPGPGEPGWNHVEFARTLTARQPVGWSAADGDAGIPSLTALDPALPPGRPDPEGANERVLRGFLVGWAVNAANEPINRNALAARAVVVHYGQGSAYGYAGLQAPAIVGAPGDVIGNPGTLDFGSVYAPLPQAVRFNFPAAGGDAYDIAGASPAIDGDLSILPLEIDLRAQGAPVTTRLAFEIWNENGIKFSTPNLCATQWYERAFGLGGTPLRADILQTNSGQARVQSQSSGCGDGAMITALCGVVRRSIAIPGVGTTDAALELIGEGQRSAQFQYDVASLAPPNGGAPHAPAGAAPPRVDQSGPGSVAMIPNVEVRWNAGGTPVGDTFIHLTNDANSSVHVQIYLVNGDAPLPANGGERAHRGRNALVGEVMLLPNQPLVWSARVGLSSILGTIAPMDALDPGTPAGRPADDGTGHRILRGTILAVAVNDDGAPISWNDLHADAIVIDASRAVSWACNAHHFAALAAHGDPVGGDALAFDGTTYAFASTMLESSFASVGSTRYSRGGTTVQASSANRIQVLDRTMNGDRSLPTTLTRLKYEVWNENEVKLSGAFRCIDDFDATPLANYGSPNHFLLANLQTDFGWTQIDGIANTGCPGSVATPVLAVLETRLDFPGAAIDSAATGHVGVGTEAAVIEIACMNPARCQAADQLGHGSGNFVLVLSDDGANQSVADNFTPVASGTVSSLCWWGSYVNFNTLVDCGPGDGDDFAIRYYRDAGGIPGALHAGPFSVTADRESSGNFIGSSIGPIAEYRYSASHPPVAVHAGTCYWVEIRNASTGACLWLQSTADGDGIGAQDVEGDGYEADDIKDWDLAFCLDVGLGDTGSCSPGCPADIDESGTVDFNDLLALLASWGSCAGCAADLDASMTVDFNDLLVLLAAWGPCP